MSWILNFCKDNVLLLIIVLLGLTLLILVFIFAPKRFNRYLVALLTNLPAFIIDCESKGITGPDKKLNYVISLSVNYLSAISGVSIEKITKKYSDLINVYVEQILAAPQKKEISNEKK